MMVLLDECLPRKLKAHLKNHECQTVPEAGFAGKKNGELLTLAETAGYDVFLTVDRGIEHQQNLQSRKIAVLLVQSRSSRLADLIPLVPAILREAAVIRPGQIAKVSY